MTASATSADPTPQPTSTLKVKRWDSPWLNPKFLIGFSMVLIVALMGVIGPLFWNENLARVASSLQNLPPPWAPGYELAAEPAPAVVVQPTVAAPSVAATERPASSGSVTGGNPFATSAPSGGSSSSGSVTGGNPFASAATPAAETSTESAAQPTVAAPVAAPVRTNPYGFGQPSWDHPMGTESNGRDMLAVLIVGAPRSLRVGLIAAGIGMFVGIFLGFTAGFVGGWVDNLIRTISDAFITIPSLAVLIVISAYVRSVSVENMALLLALFAWPGPTRLIRSQVLTMRERGYVQMARLSGASRFDIMFKEMMPNLLPYLAASFTGNVSGAILAATGLEALGLGPTRIPTLGMTIFYAIRAAAILRGMWWWWGLPIALLVVIFTGLFLMTVGLDEIANPRLRGAQQQ